MPLQSIQLGPWWGGCRYDLPVEEVSANELFDAQNIRIGTGGEVRHRPGTDSYQDADAANGGATTTMAFRFDVDASTTKAMLVAGDTLYNYSSGWSDITGSTTITAGDDNTFERVNANGTFVMTNGVDTDAIKWTGSGNASALDDNARFSKGQHIAWFDNRLWIGNVNGATGQLWYSDIADVETWGATSFYNFGGRITGLAPTQNALTVHTTDGIYTLIPTGQSDNPYHPQKRTSMAAIDGRTIVTMPDDAQVFVGIDGDGVYEWTGGGEVNKVSLALDGDDGYWSNINTSRLTQAFAERVPLTYVVAFALPYGSSQTKMNHVMYYDYRRRTTISGENVGIWVGPDVGNEWNCATVIDNNLHMGDFDGFLMDLEDTGQSDGGATIVSFFETGAPAPLGPDVTVGWVYARHYYDGNGFDIDVLQKGSEIRGVHETLGMGSTGLVLPALLPQFMNEYPRQYAQDLPLLGVGPMSSIRYAMNAAGQEFTIYKTQLWFDGPTRSTKPAPESG